MEWIYPTAPQPKAKRFAGLQLPILNMEKKAGEVLEMLDSP
jgi:hypothetical protein